MEFSYQKTKELSVAKCLSLEWLETNGLGGYSSSTIINCHTRKYHGLLVSNLTKPSGKYVLLSKVEDILLQDKREYCLSASQYTDCLQDGSFSAYQNFNLTTHPRFVYKFGNAKLTKEIMLLAKENIVLIKYTINDNKRSCIKLRPLIAARDFHALACENQDISQNTRPCKNGYAITPYAGLPTLYLQTDAKFEFLAEPLWYRDYEYIREKERGFDYQEDLFTPGIFTMQFNNKGEIIFACSTRDIKQNLNKLWQAELNYRLNCRKEISGSSLQQHLQQTGQSFIQHNLLDKSLSIVAGYHWFVEWGRDAMISLPGLTLYNGHEKTCLAILRKFAQQEHKGLIPNFLGRTTAENAYNSVDASLWFSWAVQQYYLKTKDLKSIKQYLWSTLKNIFSHYKQGTLYDIGMQQNGLLYAGNAKLNLTWMDAMVNEMPVIPRYGVQVEVNALWYNMICFLFELAQQFADSIQIELQPLIKQVKTAFRTTFWSEDLGYLKDYVNSQQESCSIRPNQIFAISMPYSPLTKKVSLQIIKVVIQHLLTPYGLRTLSPDDVNYIGCYAGNAEIRDKAYHNGTVWPWLLGHFCEALVKLFLDRHKVTKVIQPCMDALQQHLFEGGIGSISEVFDGDMPHKPNGCISQAWSVAEILRTTYILK
jgi:predicted glycogen debranching enzyme